MSTTVSNELGDVVRSLEDTAAKLQEAMLFSEHARELLNGFVKAHEMGLLETEADIRWWVRQADRVRKGRGFGS